MRKERENKIREQAKDALKGLQLAESFHLEPDLHSWYLRQLGTSMYQTEIRLLRFGRLLIHGDTPLVVFSGYSGNKKGVLDWVAYSGIDYISSKVISNNTYEFDADIAKDDLQDLLKEASRQDEEYDEQWKKDIKEISDAFNQEPTQFCLEKSVEFTAGYEEYSGVGQVVNSDIIWAQMLVRRLVELGKNSEYDLFGDRR